MSLKYHPDNAWDVRVKRSSNIGHNLFIYAGQNIAAVSGPDRNTFPFNLDIIPFYKFYPAPGNDKTFVYPDKQL